MKFGLFGSAQAQRGGADMDGAQGFKDFVAFREVRGRTADRAKT